MQGCKCGEQQGWTDGWMDGCIGEEKQGRRDGGRYGKTKKRIEGGREVVRC